MKKFKFNKVSIIVLAVMFTLGLVGPISAFAATATTVDLGSIDTDENNFVILSKTGITDVPTSVITGNIGTSLNEANTDTAFAGLTCPEVTGLVYSFNSTDPLSCVHVDATLIGDAVGDMETAYTYAAGELAGTGAFLNQGSPAGTLNGQIFAPGVYTWATPVNVTITGNITLSGGPNDVWVFQIPGTLDLETSQKILLSGGAQAKNIFWQVADTVTIKADSTFEGNILAQTLIAMQSGAILHGRALAQTAVTLIGNTINAGVVSTNNTDDNEAHVSHSSSGSTPTYGCKDPTATNYNYFSSSRPELCTYASVAKVVTPTVIVPKLPKTGFPPQTWYESLLNSLLNLFR